MRKKGYQGTESPEKMPVRTAGIQMSRGQKENAPTKERLTGGNASADEARATELVTQFIRRSNG